MKLHKLGYFCFISAQEWGVNHLCLLFGVTPSSCSRYLSIVLKLIVRVFLKENLRGRKLAVDQGFPRSGEAFDVFVGPYSEKTVEKLSPLLREHLLMIASVYISLRQAAEWGMRSLQGSFPRLKARLLADAKKRRRIILSIALVHNFRTELVGLKQIATVFDPEYQQFVSIEGYDRIRRYFFH